MAAFEDSDDPILDGDDGGEDEAGHQMFRGGGIPEPPPEETPLMGQGGKRLAERVNYIKVILDIGPTGERGYKGRVAPNTTVEGLYRRFGNGVYKLEACNHKHKVLNTREDVEIAIEEGKPKLAPNGSDGGSMANALAMFANMSEAHQQRQAELAADTQHNISTMAQENAAANAKMQEERRQADERRYESQLVADRERSKESRESQQTFFSSMMAMVNATNAQTIAMMNASTDREREASKERAEREREAAKERASSETDPMTLANVMLEGMKMGQGLGDPPDEPWVKALGEGSSMIGNIAQMFQTQRAGAPPGAVPGVPGPMVTPAPLAALPAPATGAAAAAPANGAAAPKRRRVPFSKTAVIHTARLQALLRKRGVTLEDYLAETLKTVEGMPPEQPTEMSVDAASQQSPDSHEPERALPAGSDRSTASVDALHQGPAEQQIPA